MQSDIAQFIGCFSIFKIKTWHKHCLISVYTGVFLTLFQYILINWIECKTSEALKQGWILILYPEPSIGKPRTREFHSAKLPCRTNTFLVSTSFSFFTQFMFIIEIFK